MKCSTCGGEMSNWQNWACFGHCNLCWSIIKSERDYQKGRYKKFETREELLKYLN